MGHKHNQDILISLAMGERERNPHADHLDTLNEPAELAEYLKRERESVIARAKADARRPPQEPKFGGLQLTHELSSLMDAVITRLFALACQRVGANTRALSIA